MQKQINQSVLADMKPSQAIIKLAVPATLALLAKAVYNLVDTAYIGMLDSDIALAAVGVTLPLLLIMVSVENIFAAGAAVLAGRQLGAKDKGGTSRTVTTIVGLSMGIGISLCVAGILFIEPLLRSFGASDAVLPLAKDYAFWMFIASAPLPDADSIIAAYGVVQRLILIGCYVVMGFMQGYQPVASYAFGAKNEGRFHRCVQFSLRGSLILTAAVAAVYILLSRLLILLFNRNPSIVTYGVRLLVSQVALYPAFGLCYMMTITFQTFGASGYGLFLSCIRQGLFYVPFILLLPPLFGVMGIYLAQPAADILTVLVCLFSIKRMKSTASKNMLA